MHITYYRIRRRRWPFNNFTLIWYLLAIGAVVLSVLVGFGVGRAEAAGIRLEWDPYVQGQPPVAPADGFRMYRCQGTACNQAATPLFAPLNPTLLAVTLTTYTDSTITQGTTYCYTMSAVSVVAGDSLFSNSVCAQLSQPPAAPTRLRGTALK